MVKGTLVGEENLILTGALGLMTTLGVNSPPALVGVPGPVLDGGPAFPTPC